MRVFQLPVRLYKDDMNDNKKFLLCWAADGLLQAAVSEDARIIKRETFSLRQTSAGTLAEFAGEAEAALCPGGCLGIVGPGTHQITEAVCRRSADEELGYWDCDAVLGIMAAAAEALGVPAYYTEAMSVDELLPACRIGSHASVPKYSRGFRAEHLAMLHTVYGAGAAEDGNYIAVWADDLVSIGAYSRGRCLDLNDCIGAEGPMGFTSSGDIPCAQLAGWFASRQEELEEMRCVLLRESGILGYTGTSNPAVLDQLCEADQNARLAVKAMAYQMAKWSGSAALTLRGTVDGIAVGGKGAHSETLMAEFCRKVSGIAPVAKTPETGMAEWLARKAALLHSYAEPLKTD